ncbi:hypothetical protein RGU70_09630 [Herbaspirillum sp. RTI4]|uniref:hypothetical protein n=1 Tax=Herbaspirillum sp. RTI4 TaxID=3048640 RepID=UPI002AB41155|nr:hypothetical protein [Herbaspirillum sp. RTI4]MDY7578583.1 hypothetical protein [Herbaspirillum sp. RTI4]MEA9981111.1 hypothetical protein [Herbaspirillum sp. RTI4]
MKKHSSLALLLSVALIATLPLANAQTATPDATATAAKVAKKPVKKAKKTVKSKTGERAASAESAKPKQLLSSEDEDDENEPDVGTTKSADFSCDLGQKLTIFKNDADDKHIAIRWNKHLNRLTRVGTTTGANRFENRKVGLVWIGIPAKGILLDAKKGQQLANECKNNDHEAAETGILATPIAKN